MRDTHRLKVQRVGQVRDSEQKQVSEGHSLSGEHRGDKLDRKKQASKGHSLPGKYRWRDKL